MNQNIANAFIEQRFGKGSFKSVLLKAILSDQTVGGPERRRRFARIWMTSKKRLKKVEDMVFAMAVTEEQIAPDQAISDWDWDKIFEWVVKIIELIMSFL